MKLKKSIVLGSLSLLAAMTLAACGNNQHAGKTQIEFMTSSVEQERLAVINELVSSFEKTHPDIHVNVVPVDENAYNTKVVTLARANKMPEVVEVSQDFAKVMDKVQLINQEAVDEIMSDVGEDTYYDGAKRLVRSENGQHYIAAPISGWVQGIWYDKKQLATKGITDLSSWEKVEAAAKAFNDPKNKKFGIAMPTADSVMSEQAFSQFALSNKANVLNAQGQVTFDTPEMKEALSFYQNLSQYTMPGSNDVTEINDAFMNGTVPMAIYSTYIIPGIFEAGKAENLGFAIPTNKSEAVYGTVSGLTIAANKSDDKTEAAKEFVTYLSSQENMEKWVLMSPGGAQPVNKNIVNSSTYQNNEVIQAFGKLPTEIANSFDKVQVFGLVGEKNFNKMGNITSAGIIGRAVHDVTVGNHAVGPVLEKAQAEAQKTTNED
ncbi:ABC transporter substrate-binding protein [Lactococcus garvieae]|uniref:ABC-type sugar transport system, periplasmic binding protein YcjN n=1 Tax=Lactococcus garvieae DCC43 TaxID=1231377 RepID=K2PPL4_9LACT|nr:extracellular solute-binding protein [Lactococcus garvieae]EKF52224.1 ABC-type sugar transport system, periplasmic binding protein YcjN [Lactococcus garvieae DCC43]